MEGASFALPPEAAGSQTGSAGREHLRPGSLSAAPRGGQRERPHLTQGRGKGRGSGALSYRRHPGAPTVPGRGGAGAAKPPGRGAPSGRSEGTHTHPRPRSPPRGGSPTAGGGRGNRNAQPAVSNATAPPRPPPLTAVWSRPLSANQHSPLREEGVICISACGLAPPTTPLVETRRGTRSPTNPARGRRGSACGGLSEPAWAGPAGPGGVRDARCGRRWRPRGPPWCEALPR